MSVQWVTIVATSTFFGIFGQDIAVFTETVKEPVSTTAGTSPDAGQIPTRNPQSASTSLSFPSTVAPTDSGPTRVLASSIPQRTSISPKTEDMSAPDVSAAVEGNCLKSSTMTGLETTARNTPFETSTQNSFPSSANAVVPTQDGPPIKIGLVLGITIANFVLLVFTVWYVFFRRKKGMKSSWWKIFKWGTRYSLKPVPYDLELPLTKSAVTLTPLNGAPATRKEKVDSRDNPGTLHLNQIARALGDVKGVKIPSRFKQKSDLAKRNVPDTAQIPSVPHTPYVNGW